MIHDKLLSSGKEQSQISSVHNRESEMVNRCAAVDFAEDESTFSEIAKQWDANVSARAHELEEGIDDSYNNVLVPNILRYLLQHSTGERVLDVGCGLGFLSNRIAVTDKYQVDAIDISSKSIDYAKNNFPLVMFHKAEISKFTESNCYREKFNACVANMVFHNTPQLEKIIRSIRLSLINEGTLIITIPHPFLWETKRIAPQYTNSSVEKYYRDERNFKVPFKIRKGQEHPSWIIYFHRPTEYYENALISAGFGIEYLDLLPVRPTEPDILVIVARKQEQEKRLFFVPGPRTSNKMQPR